MVRSLWQAGLLSCATLAAIAMPASSQEQNWIYIFGNGEARIYLNRTMYRDARQPSAVLYSILYVPSTPIRDRIASMSAEMRGSCQSPRARLLKLSLFDSNGILLTDAPSKNLSADIRQRIESIDPGSGGDILLDKACEFSQRSPKTPG